MIVTYQTLVILISVFGFLLGSVLFAKVVPRVARGIDIEQVSEDGNPGTSNVLKYCGAKLGILTGIFEFGKGFLPVAIGLALIPVEERTTLFGLIIIAPVLGHMFSIFHYGNGGLGVAPACGALICVFLQCRLALFMVALYILAKFVLRFKHQHRRTIFVFGCFLAMTLIFGQNPIYTRAFAILATVIIIKCLYVELKSEDADTIPQSGMSEGEMGNMLN
ncbi:MAG: glycerol-3-phosphate acyltransferase [Clostridiales bacterium]|nr:glycerol-3-phosphate acyltransferase [Clostridiales bacterium]